VIVIGLRAHFAFVIAEANAEGRRPVDEVDLLLADAKCVTACVERHRICGSLRWRSGCDRKSDDEESCQESDGKRKRKPMRGPLHGLRRGVTVAYGVGPYRDG
jgi:hypothetical protein